MKRLTLPKPPDPDAPQYKGNTLAYNRAVFAWMSQVKGLTETAHNLIAKPAGQQMQVTAFTTTTTLSGTATGTVVAQYLCSLVQALTDRGIISPTITIGDTQ
jgi:hypothetical protein